MATKHYGKAKISGIIFKMIILLEAPALEWSNVVYSSGFVVISLIVSRVLGLGLEAKLFISSVRCVTQLTILALILKPIFEAESPLYTSILGLAMLCFGAFEVSVFKTKLTYNGIFPLVFICLAVTSGMFAIIGSAFVIRSEPWYNPQELIPTYGMLLGNSCTAIALGVNTILAHFDKDRDKIEMALAFGANKWEAVLPYLKNSIKVAMLPILNSMSVMGIVTIPGMMTGQVLSGTPPLVAVKYQQIIMFLIGASVALSTFMITTITFLLFFDKKQILLVDQIKKQKGLLTGFWKK